MPVKKKVTLEQVYAKLVDHDRHFEKHDRQFEGITKLLFRVEDSLKGEIAKLSKRVEQLETILEKQTGDLEKLQQEYFALVQSVKRIEKNLESRPKRQGTDTVELSQVLARLDRIERQLGLVNAGPGSAP